METNLTTSEASKRALKTIKASRKNLTQFWYEDDKEKMKISLTKTYRFLDEMGINLLRINDSWLMIETKDNVVREVDETYIAQLLLRHIRQSNLNKWAKDKVEDALRGKNRIIVAKDQLMLLDQKEVEFKRDGEKNCYLYYQNQWLDINDSEIISREYSSLDSNVWESQLLNRKIDLLDIGRNELLEESEFGQFLWNVCSQNQERFDGLCSLIGYLLHQYKDPSEAVAVVFMDEKISDNPEGRTGKGIVMNALGYIREVARQEGKNFKFGGRYTYQDIRLSTSILAFDDVRENFDFEKLFSVITEGIDVERRWAHKLRIEQKDSPKVLITTNYVLKGDGGSHIGRRKEFEFSQYYDIDNTPKDEFGHNFFLDWDEKQWNLFDNFMVKCIQLFLEKGILDVEAVNVKQKRITSTTCPEFIEFIANYKLNKKYNRNEAMRLFEEMYPEISNEKWYTNRQFVKWLKAYAEHNGYKYSSDRMTKGESTFIFHQDISTEEIDEKVKEVKRKLQESSQKEQDNEDESKEKIDPTIKIKEMIGRLSSSD